jgi:long-subunit fatty acid transport protein
VAWMPNDRWTVTADIEWQEWSEVPPAGDRVLDSGLAWEDLYAYKLGLEWKAIPDRLTFMAGFSYSEPSVQEEHTFVNAFVPTIIKAHYTAGATWHINEHHSVHAVYLRSAKNTMKQPFGGDLIGALAWGSELEVSAHSFSLGYSYEF